MTPDQINEFFSFLYKGRLGQVTFWLRPAAGIITSALAAAIIVITVKFRQLGAKRSPAAAPAETAARGEAGMAPPWREVSEKINSTNPSDWNLAVIKADVILDGVLKERGLSGATMGERLKQMDRSRFSALDGAWEAHKLRNRIAHENARVLNYAEARRAVMLYAETLKEFGYLKE